MKILLIGNGFDLAHELPTKYSDFLDLCEGVNSGFLPNASDNMRYRDFSIVVSDDIGRKFKKLVGLNAWINHLIERRTVLGDKWIDFEAEINYVIMTIYNSIESSSYEKYKSGATSFNSLIRTIREKYNSRFTYKMLFEYLLKELKDLTKALEMYFYYYVDKKPVVQISLINSLKFNKLLSFNYTTTCTENYSCFDVDDFQSCYIHGKACETRDADNCNLVLGYDDHYLEEGKAILETIPFEKYYQRIIKRTDNSYLQWLSDIETNKIHSELFVYGHSLSPADGDVLRKFISCQYIKTVVFCRNEDDRANKTANLSIVLEPDNLIKLAGGINPAIEFRLIE